jgi:hypothetical protein
MTCAKDRVLRMPGGACRPCVKGRGTVPQGQGARMDASEAVCVSRGWGWGSQAAACVVAVRCSWEGRRAGWGWGELRPIHHPERSERGGYHGVAGSRLADLILFISARAEPARAGSLKAPSITGGQLGTARGAGRGWGGGRSSQRSRGGGRGSRHQTHQWTPRQGMGTSSRSVFHVGEGTLSALKRESDKASLRLSVCLSGQGLPAARWRRDPRRPHFPTRGAAEGSVS